MTSIELLSKFETLEHQLKQVLQEKSSLKSELKEAQLENERLKDELEMQNEDLKNFQNQHKISKIVTSMAGSTQNATELRALLNEYIREIDKCIAHLSE